jgi:hypothetical protein
MRHAATNKKRTIGYKILSYYRTAKDWELNSSNPVDSAHLTIYKNAMQPFRSTLGPTWVASALRRVLFLAIVAFLLSLSTRAEAYAWMIRHGYTACATCHVDPSGSGILTAYGRVVGNTVVATSYGGGDEDIGTVGEVLWGAVPLPEWLMLSGDVRGAWLTTKIEGAPVLRRTFLMRADFEAAVHAGGVVASGSIGYAEEGGFGSALTRAPEKNLVSREHWLGYELDQDSGLMLRAGRMNLPFGIRILEHTSWVRSLSSTSINDDQQYGVAANWSPSSFRAELFAIAGNYQLRPDAYRERGVSALVEWLPFDGWALGASTLNTYRRLHPTYLLETWHHAGALFTRWAAPWSPLVLLAEFDYVYDTPKLDEHREGAVAFVQLDIEPVRGLHLFMTAEAHNVGIDTPPESHAFWISPAFHFLPQLDVRVDNIYQSVGSDSGRTGILTMLAQIHAYL